MAKTWKPHKPWREYPLRQCRTLHYCEACKKDILLGEMYYDGGYGRRVHEDCVCEICGYARTYGHWHAEDIDI
jgi:hypothetical protein